MKNKVDKHQILKNSYKSVKRFVENVHSMGVHFVKTLKKEYEAYMAYKLKVTKLDEKMLKNTHDELLKESDVTIQTYIDIINWKNALDNYKDSIFLTKMIPDSIVVSTISRFDYYIFDLLHGLLVNDSGLINTMDSKVQLKEIICFDNTEDIMEYYISTFIEGLFFGSHDELFETIDKKFNVKNIKKIDGYKDFIFVAELRNLIVHHDGKISLKFKSNMLKYSIKYEKYNMIDENGYISLDFKNVMWILELCVQTAIQIYLTISQKYARNNAELLDEVLSNLNTIGLDLISWGYLSAAECIFDKVIKDNAYKDNLGLLCTNKALCLKRMGRVKEMEEVLKMECFELENEYIMAKYILLDDFVQAVDYMDKVELLRWECGYQDWPLCSSFIENELFKKKYKEIYGYDFEKKIKKGKLSDRLISKMAKEYQTMLTSKENVT